MDKGFENEATYERIGDVTGFVPVSFKDYYDAVRELLETEFTNGVRPSSIIDQNKMRRLFKQRFNREVPQDFDFVTILSRLGVVHDGKVFPKPSMQGGGWLEFLVGLMEQGNRLLWFSRVMELHADEMIRRGIASAEMLREVMVQSASDKFEIAENRFAPKGTTLDVVQIVRKKISEDTVRFSESELREQLPYVDKEELHGVFRNNPDFLKIGSESYVVTERVELDSGDVGTALAEVKNGIEREGYFSLAKLDFSESAAMNDFKVGNGALSKIFFDRYLSSDYKLYGQIIARQGEVVDGRIPLRMFCRENSEMTLEQIKNICAEYNISFASSIAVLHEEMVRVDFDHFVAPSLVDFDVDGVDKAITLHRDGSFPSLPSFRNFCDFPSVTGYSWNVYLLESFLRRASKVYGLLTLSEGSMEPLGVLVRFKEEAQKDKCPREELKGFSSHERMNLLLEILAQRLIGAKQEPSVDVIGDYLVQNGYIQRRSSRFLNRLLTKMGGLVKEQKN